MPETLEFEEPIAILLKEIEALDMLPQTDVRDGEIEGLRRRIDQIRGEIYKRLTPWQRVLVARHPERPYLLDYVERLFTEFVELHGDRRFADDGAIVCGFARYHGAPVMVCGHQKGRDMKQKVQRNFGYARPEGYRKALRAMQMADKFGRPIIVFVDTPAAYPGVESEERGIAEAIALNLREMAILSVPIIVVITGEGGSGGALGLAIGDRVLMQEFAVYSVIPPEGCAAILWRDASRKIEAAEALKITAPDLIARGIVDGVVPEPLGGAHQDADAAAAAVDLAVERRAGRGRRARHRDAAAGALRPLPASRRARRRHHRHGGARGRAPARTELSRRCERDAGSRSSGPIPPTRAGGPDACDRDAHIAALATALDVPPVVARLLCQRGIDTPEAAARFLSPSVDHLHDPFLLTDLGIAVERLLAAIARKERIAIHGDYDVDGVTSTVILRRTLELLGGDVTHFLPERLRDGYGLQPANVDRLHAAGARVIVSVDCGIRSGAAADRARELGIDLIISDHHEPEATLPRALAVINPKRSRLPLSRQAPRRASASP